ncbi:UNVERIFIED_CONTAM: hypothetical protein FKN15_069320 [Acipenser sinensis]
MACVVMSGQEVDRHDCCTKARLLINHSTESQHSLHVNYFVRSPHNVVEADTLGSFKKLLDEILGSISY